MKAITIVLIIILTIVFGTTVLHYLSLFLNLVAKGIDWLSNLISWGGIFKFFD